MDPETIKLHPQWLAYLQPEFEQDYLRALCQFLFAEKSTGGIICPSDENIFAAFNATPLKSVKVVILGQDPYHGPNQAHGLSFSVMPDVKMPPSLRNLYQELSTDLGVQAPSHGYLMDWAQQGVLLLNAVLTVEQGRAGSHQGKGWERFTDKVIEVIDAECDNVVFMLWGAYAQKKGAVINTAKHLVLSAPHPSPLSAYRGFFGCRHFSKANDYLEDNARASIDWQIR
ncbi:MAG: uracil-DNA glycosylase [Arenicella sp.]|nr:uracil-DNA glycosylase [Arenicella sp.]